MCHCQVLYHEKARVDEGPPPLTEGVSVKLFTSALPGLLDEGPVMSQSANVSHLPGMKHAPRCPEK